MTSPATIYATLFFLTFMHEDVAVVTDSYFISQDGVPVALAYLSLYLGIVLSDILLYLPGMLARYVPRARQWLIRACVVAIRHIKETFRLLHRDIRKFKISRIILLTVATGLSIMSTLYDVLRHAGQIKSWLPCHWLPPCRLRFNINFQSRILETIGL